ncbi:LPXTG cell wall anchor domain-containing protein [Microbacterium oleivorans]|uniref:LPXTG cell wall anchor domain-containing protein n=1 Tax=Microbacterium oleivorans TaxID=273677 RepID=UPI0010A2E4E1|nr:LPXTG cell wall anchor domain-containing protein [Microbacterium oleivorans]THE06809.1 LPXTG cell wall anchor domain-containing protein [Microbacterium oleivorans]
MNTMLSRALLGTLVAGGITLFGAAAAQAAEPTTSGEDGLLSGTQALLNVDVPISVGDTAISLLGDSSTSSSDKGSSPAPSRDSGSASTSGSDGAASGSQAIINVSVPVTVKDTAVSVIGDSSTKSTDAAPAAPAKEPAKAPAASTSGSDGIGSGTQVVAPVKAPVTVKDTAVSVIGDSKTESTDAAAPAASSSPAPSVTTDGSDGAVSGTQVVAPITVPVTVEDVAISIIGDSTTESTDAATPAAPATGTTGTPSTDGSDGIGSGTQVVAPVTVPVTVDDTAVSIIGDSTTESTDAATPAAPATGTTGTPSTDGSDGIGSGTQVVAPITLPVTIDDTAVSVIGDSTTVGGGTAGTPGTGTTPGAPVTSGENGVGSGTQILLPIDIPVTIGDTAVSIIGDSTVTDPGTDPTDPVDPVDPVDPTDPVDPVTPGTDPTDPTDPGTNPANPGTVPGDTPGMGTDDEIPGAGAAPMAPQASASTPVGTLAQTGGVAVTWLPALALALLAAGALLTLRRRTV